MGEQRSFPLLSDAQRLGATGVTIVTRLVEDQLGWRFRRNHQEDDFGIDGYIDLIGPQGEVLGKAIAVQIKTGLSHIEKESPQGFKLADDLKHLNYFLNSPIPVILVLVKEKKGVAWWVHVRPQAVRIASKGWSILIPKSQQLNSSSRTKLLPLAGPVVDYQPLVKRMNAVREEAAKFDMILFSVSKAEVEQIDVSRVIEYFEMFEAAPDQLPNVRNKLMITVGGYDDDPREVFEIPEVRKWFCAAEKSVLGWGYYLALDAHYSTWTVFLTCTCKGEIIGSSEDGENKLVSIPPPEILAFLHRHFQWLNEFTEKHGFSEQINREVSEAMAKAVYRITRFDPPPKPV